MSITPSIRKNAHEIDRHHMNWRHKNWIHASETHRQVKEMGAFIIHLPRHWHDRLHVVLEPLAPPNEHVVNALGEIGTEHATWNDDGTRIESMLDDMVGYARTELSPERSDGMLEVASHYSAQLGVYQLSRSVR